MHRILFLLAVFFIAAPVSAAEKEALKPKVTISKTTTFITKPVTEDGYVDYAAALNERFGKGVTPQNNANVLYWRAIGPTLDGEKVPVRFFKLLAIKAPPEEREYFVDFFTYLKETRGIDPESKEGKRAEEHFWNAMDTPWNAEAFPHVAAWLKVNEKPLKLVVAGTQRSRFYSPVVVPSAGKENELSGLVDAMARGVTQFRNFSRALTARALWHVKNGRIAAARNDLTACHQLARHVGSAPFLINALVGIAIDGFATKGDLALLQHGKLNRKTIAQMLGALQQLPPLPVIADKVDLGERLVFLDAALNVARSTNRELLKEFGVMEIDKKALRAVDWDIVLKHANRWYGRIVETMREPNPVKRRKALGFLNKKFLQKIRSVRDSKLFEQPKLLKPAVSKAIANVLLANFMPAVEVIQEAEDRAVQHRRNLQAACALELYRIDQGRYPAKLKELQPKFLKTLPGDVFSTEPLKYRLMGTGYLLYSVGPNGRDERGRGHDADAGADDIAVRMLAERN